MSLRNGGQAFRRGWRRLVICIVLLSALLAYSSRQSPIHLINRLPSDVISPLKISAGKVGFWLSDYFSVYISNSTAASRLKTTERELARLQSRLVEVDHLKRQVAELREQLEFSESRKDLDLVSAELITRNTSEFGSQLLIKVNTQINAEIDIGDPVIASNALIGQIIKIENHIGTVMLLTDPKSAVDIRLKSSQARGVAIGTSQGAIGGLRLKYLSQDERIEEGEEILTSGLDGKFPSDLPIGHVEYVDDKTSGESKRVHVRPTIQPEKLRYVFIVVGHSGLSSDGNHYQEKP